jgi:hypothetical protein
MKKHEQRLSLSRETVRNLDPGSLTTAMGGTLSAQCTTGQTWSNDCGTSAACNTSQTCGPTKEK